MKILLNMCANRAMLKRKPIFIFAGSKVMKKLILTLTVIGLLAIGGFILLLSQTTADNAPSGPVITDLTEQLGE